MFRGCGFKGSPAQRHPDTFGEELCRNSVISDPSNLPGVGSGGGGLSCWRMYLDRLLKEVEDEEETKKRIPRLGILILNH